MKKKKTIVALLLSMSMSLLALSGCGSTETADSGSGAESGTSSDDSIVLKLGSVGSGSEYDELGYACYPFIEAVEELSDGRITVEFYPNGQLGGEDAMLDQVMTGSLDFACLSGSVLTTIWPDFTVYTLPFAYESIDTFWEIDEAGAFDELENITRDSNKGAVWLGSFACTFRGFSNTERPIRTAADMQGLQTRVVTGEAFTDIFRALGCNTANVAYAELYSALQQGVVNSEDNGIVTDYDRKFYEIEGYHTQINMIPNVNSFIMSSDTIASLSDEDMDIILQAIDIAEESHHTAVNELIDKVAGMLEDEGVDVIMRSELTDEEMQTFYDATQPVWDKYAAAIDEDFYNNWMTVREQVQG